MSSGRAAIRRFVLWWAGCTGLFAITMSCPCCGRAACPVGAGLLGLVSATLALAGQLGGLLRRMAGRKAPCPQADNGPGSSEAP